MEYLLDATRLAEITQGVPWACIDFETAGRSKREAVHPILADPIGFAVLTPKGLGYAPLYSPPGEGAPVISKEAAGDILRPLLLSTPIINWNQKFDSHLERTLTGAVPCQPVDPMVGLWLLSETSPLGLKGALGDLTQAHFPDFSEIMKLAQEEASERVKQAREDWALGQKASGASTLGKARREANSLFSLPKVDHYGLPVRLLAPYACRDVVATALLWFGYVRPSLAQDGLLTYFYRYEMPFLDCLTSMEAAGITLDLDRCRALAVETLAEIADTASQIYDLAGEEFNLNSNAELGRVLFERLGFTPSGRLTATGNVSLDERAIKDLLWDYQDQTKIFDLLLSHRVNTKLYGTYAKALPEWAVEGVVYPRFSQTGTATGRLSSSDPNLQNQPRDKRVRSVWRAREGKVLISTDLSQGELRVLAHRTQDPALLDVYRTGGDLHSRTMAKFGIANRTIAKNANFGLVYGVGPKTFREGLLYDAGARISDAEARRYIGDLYDLYGGINPWKEKVWEYAAQRGYVETFLGRRRHLPELLPGAEVTWGERSYAERQAVNSCVQGDVADLERIAMIRLRPIFRQFGGELILQVHDDVLGEVDEDKVEAACPIIKDTVEGLIPDFRVPIVSEVKFGKDWGHMQEYQNVT